MTALYTIETTATGTGTSAAPSTPTGTASGDLLVAALNTGSGSTALAPPAGWTAIVAAWTDSNDSAGATWYKVAGGSEPASYTFTWTTSGDYCCSVKRFTAANTSTPIRTGARHDKAPATGASFTSNALSGTQATDLTVVIGQMGDDAGVTTFTVTMPGSPWTTIDNFKSFPKFQGASYATGPQSGATFTSSSANAYWNITSFAIVAASAPATTRRPMLAFPF